MNPQANFPSGYLYGVDDVPALKSPHLIQLATVRFGQKRKYQQESRDEKVQQKYNTFVRYLRLYAFELSFLYQSHRHLFVFFILSPFFWIISAWSEI